MRGDPAVEPIFELVQARDVVQESQRPRPPDEVETLIDRGRASPHFLICRNKPYLSQHIIQRQVVLSQQIGNGVPGSDGDFLPGRRLHETSRFLSKTTIPVINKQRLIHGQ